MTLDEMLRQYVSPALTPLGFNKTRNSYTEF